MNITLPIEDVELSKSLNNLKNLTKATEQKVRAISHHIHHTKLNTEPWIENDVIYVILFSALLFIAILGGIAVLKYCSQKIM